MRPVAVMGRDTVWIVRVVDAEKEIHANWDSTGARRCFEGDVHVTENTLALNAGTPRGMQFLRKQSPRKAQLIKR